MPVLFEIFIIACGAIMKGLFIPGVTELGASSDSFPSGIVIPGANVMTLPPGEWVDLSDIDLTSSALDYRVSFSCASNHAYYSADGTIQFAAPDVWPLEYRNGVAVGRHEPEPQGTNLSTINLLAGSWTQGYAAISVADAGTGLLSGYPARKFTVVSGASRSCASAHIPGAQRATLTAYIKREPNVAPTLRLYSGVTGDDYSARLDVNSLKFTTNKEMNARATAAGEWVIARISCAPAGAIYAYLYPWFDGDAGRFATFCGWQVEESEQSTSPIDSAVTGGTRASAFASVRVYPGLTGLRISYSDGSTETVRLDGQTGDWYPLRAATGDWGSRYIQRIEYIR